MKTWGVQSCQPLRGLNYLGEMLYPQLALWATNIPSAVPTGLTPFSSLRNLCNLWRENL